MTKECLVALDLTEGCEPVAAGGRALASALGANTAWLHVDELAPRYARLGMSDAELAPLSARYRADAERQLRRLGAPSTARIVVRAGRPAEIIVEEACECRVEAIVLGAHQYGSAPRVLGRNLRRVVRDAPCPVLTVPTWRPWPDIRKVVYGCALDEESLPAGRLAAELAGKVGAELVIAHVPEGDPDDALFHAVAGPPGPFLERTRRALADLAGELAAHARRFAAGPVDFRQIVAPPGDESLNLQEVVRAEHPDLLVIGTHQRHGLARVAFGSVAERLLVRADWAILTVRGGEPT